MKHCCCRSKEDFMSDIFDPLFIECKTDALTLASAIKGGGSMAQQDVSNFITSYLQNQSILAHVWCLLYLNIPQSTSVFTSQFAFQGSHNQQPMFNMGMNSPPVMQGLMSPPMLMPTMPLFNTSGKS